MNLGDATVKFVGQSEFTLTGVELLDNGWLRYDDNIRNLQIYMSPRRVEWVAVRRQQQQSPWQPIETSDQAQSGANSPAPPSPAVPSEMPT